MANVLLTQRCVRSCPYCFAKKHISDSSPDDLLSWENLIYLADIFELSGERNMSLLGGEPTLHPLIAEFLVYLLKRNFVVRIFTSGIMSEKTLERIGIALDDVPDDRVTFICNFNEPQNSPSSLAEVESVKRFLKSFGNRTVPGFNVYHPEFRLEFLFDLINEFGLKRHIRLGVANPIPGRNNSFVSPEEMATVISRIFDYAPLFERFRIKPGLDCGFPLCMFSDENLGWLYRHTGGVSRFGCAPVIDIGPDMSVWSCFPLSSIQRKSIFEFDTLQDVVRFYNRMMGAIRMEVGGIYEKCDDCAFREECACSGGCAAHLLSRFQEEARVRVPEVYL